MRAMPTRTDTSTPMKKGWSLGGAHDELAEGAGRPADGGRDDPGGPQPRQNGDDGGDQNVHPGLLGHGFATSAAMMATNSTASGPPAPPRALQA